MDINTKIVSLRKQYGAGKNRLFRRFIDHLANRQRRPKNFETTVDGTLVSMRLGPEFRQKIVEFLQWIASAGAGKFVTGRRGKRSRLVWEIEDPIEFAKFVSGAIIRRRR